MRLVLLSMVFIFGLANISFSQTRSTSFDDKPICERTGGVWRQFGNSCVDRCEAQFNPFTMCAMSLKFGCDCGENSCWDSGRCISLSSYKEIYDEEQKQRQEVLDEQKEKRRLLYEANSKKIMYKLTSPVQTAEKNTQQNNNNNSNNNISDPNKPNLPDVPITNLVPKSELEELQRIADSNQKEKLDKVNVTIPQFFLQQQKELQERLESKKTQEQVRQAVKDVAATKDEIMNGNNDSQNSDIEIVPITK